MARAEVDHRTKCIRIIIETDRALAFLGQMRAGIKEPLQIAQDSLAVALERNDPLGPAFLRLLRLVISQPVEQARLKFFDDGQFRHRMRIWRRSRLVWPKNPLRTPSYL